MILKREKVAGIVKHVGWVVRVSSEEVEVVIKSQAACSSCSAKSACGMTESADKQITIVTSDAWAYHEGEQVEVSIEQSMGLKALFFAYLLPFLLVIATLLILLRFEVEELYAGLASLGVLVVYYLGLWALKERLEREISFGIQKI